METFVKPTNIISFGKYLQKKHGLQELTRRFNQFRQSVGIRRPVKPETVRRYNNGKAGYADGVHRPYTMYLQSVDLLSPKK